MSDVIKRFVRIKNPLAIVVLMIAIPVALSGLYRLGSTLKRHLELAAYNRDCELARTRDGEFGYFKDFNRVYSALESMPGVSIMESGHNMDVKHEEFAICITVMGEHVRLFFNGSSRIRDFRRESILKVLQQRIQTKLSSSSIHK